MRRRWVVVPMSALLAACGTLLGVQSEDAEHPPPTGDGDAVAEHAGDVVFGDGGEGVDGPPGGDAASDVAPNDDSGPGHVFVTSAPYVLGSGTPDQLCNDLATSARLDGGTGGFVAWLSYSASDSAVKRLFGDGPWYDTRGNVVANDRAQLLSGALASPIRYLEDGGSVAGQYAVFTGTKANGTWSTSSCGMWDDKTGFDTEGHTGMADSTWTDQGSAFADCSANVLHLYCFEQP